VTVNQRLLLTAPPLTGVVAYIGFMAFGRRWVDARCYGL